jgi:hypothetical protein
VCVCNLPLRDQERKRLVTKATAKKGMKKIGLHHSSRKLLLAKQHRTVAIETRTGIL